MTDASIKSTDIIRIIDPETGKETILPETDLVFLALASTNKTDVSVWLERDMSNSYSNEQSLIKITKTMRTYFGFPYLGEKIFINDMEFEYVDDTYFALTLESEDIPSK